MVDNWPEQFPSIEAYAERILGKLPLFSRLRRAEIRTEVRKHVEALVQQHRLVGLDDAEALAAALRKYGEPRKIACQYLMAHFHARRADPDMRKRTFRSSWRNPRTWIRMARICIWSSFLIQAGSALRSGNELDIFKVLCGSSICGVAFGLFSGFAPDTIDSRQQVLAQLYPEADPSAIKARMAQFPPTGDPDWQPIDIRTGGLRAICRNLSLWFVSSVMNWSRTTISELKHQSSPIDLRLNLQYLLACTAIYFLPISEFLQCEAWCFIAFVFFSAQTARFVQYLKTRRLQAGS